MCSALAAVSLPAVNINSFLNPTLENLLSYRSNLINDAASILCSVSRHAEKTLLKRVEGGLRIVSSAVCYFRTHIYTILQSAEKQITFW